MLAAVYFGRNDVRVVDWPAPAAPPPGYVTIAPSWCGICGTDLEEVTAGPKLIPVEPHPITGRSLPLVLGHEGAGRVVAAGDGAGIDVGTRVGIENTISCGHCALCTSGVPQLCKQMGASGLMADGALAEAVNVPAAMCAPLDPKLPDEAGAIAEPLSVAVRAERRSGGVAGLSVQIYGGGTIGLLLAQVCRAQKASSILVLDPSPTRRAKAQEAGFDAAAPAEGVPSQVVFECTGVQQGWRDAVASTAKRGVTVVLGVHPQPRQIDLLELLLDERNVVSSLSHTMQDDYKPALELLGEKRIDFEPIITDRIRLSDVVTKGFDKLLNEPEGHLKVLVSPGD